MLRCCRCCRFCQQPFEASKFRPDQSVWSRPECQRRRRAEYYRHKVSADPRGQVRIVCEDASKFKFPGGPLIV